YRGPIDLLIVLADDDEQRLADAATALAAELEPFAEIVNVEHGKALRSQNADGFEHFGFIDGRSQPIFAQEHLVDDGPHTAWDPFEPLGLVLVRDKGVPDDEEALGSFFVFRKLEQNVRGFIERERELVAELQLPSGDRERVGAMLLGRFRDGTPLVNHSSGGQAPNDNDFAFDNANTHRCPFHAHVRKANPRGDVTVRSGQEGREMERDRRIVRRGIPYGAAATRPNASVESVATLPSDGVGLLFGCFQAHIARQFGHIQKLWFNNPGFPVDGAGVDGLMAAQPSPTPLNWLRKWGESPTHSSPFGEFVKLKGGEFFFAPSIPFVRGLRR
ncbi:MAG TPA: hypothetical protein VER33_27235, partial [Polyangiaceae bacterium]|nr:hypothetical protein [Polyangiaceae bacterium]